MAPGTMQSTGLLSQPDVQAFVTVQPADGDDSVRPSRGATAASLRYGVDLADLGESLGITGRAGECEALTLPRVHGGRGAKLPWDGLTRRLGFLGLGSGRDDDLALAGAALAGAVRGNGTVVVDLGVPTSPGAFASFARGYLSALYRPWSAARSGFAPTGSEVPGVVLLCGKHALEPLERAITVQRNIARGVWIARSLGSAPANVVTPTAFAAACQSIGSEIGLDVEVRDEQWLAANGFGGVLAVGAGAATPPRFVTAHYRPGESDAPAASLAHVVLVGKGITFDSGGLSLKPRTTMPAMKTDMAGAATVLGAVVAAALNCAPVEVTAVMPLAENMPSGSALRPGDVLWMADGSSVEVANTDAEGRLVLADAIAWARTALSPNAIIDVATLTGAAKTALGTKMGALLSNDDDLANGVLASAGVAHEPMWRLPLHEGYRSSLRSPVADRCSTSTSAVSAGTITAALFIEHFVGEIPWVHLDVAGPARAKSPADWEAPDATGFGVATVANLLAAQLK
ncbi:hypothetical protein GCM10010407_00810 [Rarobacter incanus]